MTLQTMEPTPTWDPEAFGDAVAALSAVADEATVRVWGADWCADCRAVLPDLAAALDAAGVPEDRVVQYEVEKREDGSKAGPEVEAYGIEYIPTVVVEVDGEAVARFVESEPVPAAVHLAEQIRDAGHAPA